MADTRTKTVPPRPATAPSKGAARDTLMGAVAVGLAGWMISRGVSEEVAALTGGFAMGLMTWGRKQLLEHLYQRSS